MSTAPRYIPNYTVNDYQTWDGDWELWDGVAVAMTPSPFGKHSRLVTEIARRLANSIEWTECDATVLSEIDWIVSPQTVLRPDITVVCGREPDGHVEETPALVVEVLSESTRSRDLVEKRAIYQNENVPWYLIADPDEAVLTVLRLIGDSFCETDAAENYSIDICDSCVLELSTVGLFR